MKTTMPSKLAGLLSSLSARGEVRRAGGEYRTRCPAHDDHGPSLYVKPSPDHRCILLNCKAGCEAEEIVRALDRDMGDLFLDDDFPVVVDDDFEIIDEAPSVEGTRPPAAAHPGEGDDDRVGDGAVEHAGPDQRHEVYDRLLSSLPLSGHHRQDLHRRGLDDVDIDRNGYRTLDRFALHQAVGRLKQGFDEEALLGVPGFRRRRGRVRFVDIEGLLVPVRDVRGRIIALKVRLDDVKDGPKYLWISSAGGGGPSPGSPPHVPSGTPSETLNIRLTEGELKADISWKKSGVPTLGVSGLTNWRPCLPILEALGVRAVHVAFDADAWTKAGVGRELAACVDGLTRAGFEVRLERWDLAEGKGIDDLLAAGKQPEILAGEQVKAAMLAIGTGAVAAASQDDDEDAWVPEDPTEEVEPFPLDCLPPPLRRFVSEAAAAIQCPVDFLGMGVLVVAATAIGGSRRLRVRRGYEEGPVIYGAIVARPGSAKSPALRLVCDPVYSQQQRKAEQHQRERARYEQDLAALEAWRRSRAGDNPPSNAPEKPVKPSMSHLFVSDITTESLALILAQTPRGVLLVRDELTGWVMALNQYRGGKGADRQFYLSCWSGETVKVDRKSDSGGPLLVPDPFLGVLGCIPPAKLAELDAGNDGEDGFIHRILFVFPKPLTRRRWSWVGISPETRQIWCEVVSRLYGLEMGRDKHDAPVPVVVDLAPEACRSWEDWYNAHAEEMEAADFPEILVGPWSKLVAYAVRLALIVHMLRTACGESDGRDVDAESLNRAFRLVAYFKSHARLVYARLRQSPRARQVAQAIAWIRRHGGRCNPTHLARANVAGIQKKSEAEEMMKELEDRGHGRREKQRAANNRVVTWFIAKRV